VPGLLIALRDVHKCGHDLHQLHLVLPLVGLDLLRRLPRSDLQQQRDRVLVLSVTLPQLRGIGHNLHHLLGVLVQPVLLRGLVLRRLPLQHLLQHIRLGLRRLLGRVRHLLRILQQPVPLVPDRPEPVHGQRDLVRLRGQLPRGHVCRLGLGVRALRLALRHLLCLVLVLHKLPRVLVAAAALRVGLLRHVPRPEL